MSPLGRPSTFTPELKRDAAAGQRREQTPTPARGRRADPGDAGGQGRGDAAQVAGLQLEKLILRKAAAWIAFYNYPHPANRGITLCPRPGSLGRHSPPNQTPSREFQDHVVDVGFVV